MDNRSKAILVFSMMLMMGVLTGCIQSKQKEVNAEKGSETKDSLLTGTNENYYLDEEDRNLIQKGNAFSLQLFQNIALKETKKNTFISTIGFLYSLNIMNLGAKGKTRQEICDAIGLDSLDIGRMNALCRRMIKGQEKMQNDDLPGLSSNLLTGCALLLKNDVEISGKFTHDFEQFYYGQIIQGCFDDRMQSQIDEWCSDKTDHQINNLPIERDAKSILAVVNCFKGKWEIEFNSDRTKEEPFYGGKGKTVMMMNDTDSDRRFTFAQRPGYSLLRIPYRGGYAMFVILPEKGKTLSSIIHKLDWDEFQKSVDNLSYYDLIHVKLPKFEMNYSWRADKLLESLGIRKVFDEKADLDNMNSGLYVSTISQCARVKVDEMGTDASSLTSVVLKAKEETVKEITEAFFYADHPFAYIIRDVYGNLCMMGTYYGE